jgi:hypothetical protein
MGTAAMTGVVGSAIGSGASLIGGASSTAMQNQANKEIAQMNNAFNEKMFDKQIAYNKEMYQQQLGDQWKFYNDSKQNAWDLVANQQQFQTDMWNKNNEYNSASAQRERLEAAGLNPYMMMNGGSAGTAQTMSGSAGTAPSGGAPSGQGVTPPTATPYSADYSGITAGLGRAIDVLSSIPDRKVKEAQADNLRIEGKYIAGKAMAQILQMKTEAKTKEARLAMDKLVNDVRKDLMSSQIAVNDQNIAESKARTQIAVTENLMRQKQLDFLPQQQKIELAQAAADIAFKRSAGYLNNVKAQHEIKKIAETMARTSEVTQRTENLKTENMIQGDNYRFNSQTYGTRVRIIEETLEEITRRSRPSNWFQMMGMPFKGSNGTVHNW